MPEQRLVVTDIEIEFISTHEIVKLFPQSGTPRFTNAARID